MHAVVHNLHTNQQVQLVYDIETGIVHMSDPAQPGAIPIATISRRQSDWQLLRGAIYEYRTRIAPGVDVAMIAAMSALAREYVYEQ